MGHTNIGTLLLGWAAVIILTRGDFVNVALNKSYNQSSVSASQRGADAAANGDTSGEYPENCIRTSNADTDHPWYEVDLGRVYPAYNIDIWSRSVYQSRLYPSTIAVDGDTCTSVTGPWDGRQKSVMCSEVMYGQRVRVTLNRMDQPLNLCEIQIWVPDAVSECPAGQYGPSCDMDCSDHCGEGPGKNFCDQQTANCYDECVAGWYGDQCSMACSERCGDSGCDRNTGDCESCSTGYRGDNCAECADTYYKTVNDTCKECSADCLSQTCADVTGQCHVNVALDKSYSQSSKSRSSVPDNAGANGDTTGDYHENNCMKTRYDDYPWYEVDLGRVYPVYNIDIWSRTGFYDRLFPSSITVDGETCASGITEPSSGKQKSVMCSEVMYGQRVRVTLDRTHHPLNLCEIQIWVPYGVSQCPAGQHGSSCDTDCSDHCGEGPGKNFCDQETAHCYDGCVDGWYGDQCSTACSRGCQNEDCDRDTGQCIACITGYSGDNCTECDEEHYKTPTGECMVCSSTCHLQRCSGISGACDGCVFGFYGDQCDVTCPTTNCQLCHQSTGNCLVCYNNLQAPSCTDCVESYYKPDGQDECTQCTWTCKSGTVCDQTTGHCPACPPGKQGDRCDQDCNAGWHGQECTAECGHCVNDEPCDPLTGECVEGCEDGWKTDLCNEECDDGTWGPACINICGRCKGEAACDKVTGNCPLCEPGWYPRVCDTACQDGFYGDHCFMQCGNCLNDVICNKVTGHCPACTSGKQPPLCDTVTQEDNDNTAVVAGSAVAGVVVLVIIIVIVICIVRKRRHRTNESRKSNNEYTAESTAEGSSKRQDEGLAIADSQYIYPQQESYVNAAQGPEDGAYVNTSGLAEDETYSELIAPAQDDGTHGYTAFTKPSQGDQAAYLEIT